MVWGKRQKLASRALIEGDLDTAAEHLQRERDYHSFQGRRFVRQLTEALIERAENATSVGNLALAWKDLTIANKVALSKDSDLVSKHLNQLVELTVEAADSLLANGKVTHAVQMIDQLGKRQIMDWRADRIRNIARSLHQAEELAAVGKFTDSLGRLQEAKNIQPDLPFIEAKISAAQLREIQMKELTAELQSTALKCHWSEVNDCCQKILAIAPKHQIALDAQRHCLTQIKRKTSSGLRATHVPERDSNNSFFQIGSGTSRTGGTDGSTCNRMGDRTNSGVSDLGDSEGVAATQKNNTFILWVDGVGGYLVCADRVNTIGQAVSRTSISIPIIGDLRRRHARLETVGGQHLLQALGQVNVDGEPLIAPVELKHQQVIGLEGGVELKYTQAHPLSKTARLDFVSRHRTQPWSDAVLLASQSIVLGPNRDNHVFCPTWAADLIIFQRKEKWFCRTREPFEIDGVPIEKEGEIQFDSRISGKDFSLTLESVVF